MAHIHNLPGQVDNTVSAYIVYRRSVLLIDHIKLKKWLPIGGHIEVDEDPEEALFREIDEESGLKRDQLEVLGEKPDFVSEGSMFLFAPAYLDIHEISGEHRHIGMTYFLKSTTGQIELAKDEHNAIEWMDETRLNSPELKLSPAVRFYALDAIKRLGWD